MAPSPDAATVAGLRAGDAAVFAEVVGRYHASMVRVATSFVPSRAVAEEVTQDTWIAVMRGIGGFEGRSSLRTWIFSILVHRAQTTGVREHRTVPTSSLVQELADSEPSVPPGRFAGPPGRGGWSSPPDHWSNEAEDAAIGQATFDAVARAAGSLPENQRRVLLLRDVEGWTAEEVCRVLGLSDGNQRVLLHRARSKVRAALDDEMGVLR